MKKGRKEIIELRKENEKKKVEEMSEIKEKGKETRGKVRDGWRKKKGMFGNKETEEKAEEKERTR